MELNILNFLITVSFIVTWLILNLQTDALPIYARLLHFPKFFKYNEYLGLIHKTNYPEFLMGQVKNKLSKFLLEMLSCPYCQGIWLSIIGSLVLNNLLLTALIYVSSLLLYFIIVFLSVKSYA